VNAFASAMTKSLPNMLSTVALTPDSISEKAEFLSYEETEPTGLSCDRNPANHPQTQAWQQFADFSDPIFEVRMH
jgi:hypothetical protein